MKLDAETIMWVLDNLTDYDHEYDRGPRYQEMTFRKGGEDHDFKYFFAEDIREWLAGELHQTWAHFLPEAVERDFSKGPESLTHKVVSCSCGWSKSFEIGHKAKTYFDDDSELSEAASSHRREEIKKIMERYQWDM